MNRNLCPNIQTVRCFHVARFAYCVAFCRLDRNSRKTVHPRQDHHRRRARSKRSIIRIFGKTRNDDPESIRPERDGVFPRGPSDVWVLIVPLEAWCRWEDFHSSEVLNDTDTPVRTFVATLSAYRVRPAVHAIMCRTQRIDRGKVFP